MTTDDEKDPPIPSFLEGITLNRVHDGTVLPEDPAEEDDDGANPPSSS